MGRREFKDNFKNMDSIRIKNLRSIVDSGDIQLSRINILLGKNSSGKRFCV